MRTPLPFFVFTMPHCPRCKSIALKTTRSVKNQGDGSTLRRTECTGCGYKFFLVLEPPILGETK